MKKLLLALAFCAFATCANAATCFWVGGTGTWSTANTASWASATGGTAGTCAATGGIPKQAADTATFDGSSGGGTVTVDTTINGVTLTQITMGAFTGTLDFSVNNPSITLSAAFSVTGTGTRTLKLGSGTFTLSSAGNNTIWDITTSTNLTFNAGTSTITCSSSGVNAQRTFHGGGQTYNIVNIAAVVGSSIPTAPFNIQDSGTVFTTLNLTTPIDLNVVSAFTVTNAINWNGTSASNATIIHSNSAGSQVTVTLTNGGTISFAAIYDMIFTGSPTATNSTGQHNSGITITQPSGGSHIIGG